MSQLLRERISGRAQALWLGCFSIFFLLLRLPQFLANWDGEDANGHCAAMLMGLAAPNEMIFSRIDGVPLVTIGFPHPIPPYLFFSLFGKLIRTIVPLDTLHDQTLIFALKATASLLQLSVFLALLFLAIRYGRGRTPIVWLWVMSITPVALYSSNEIQPDSTTGFVFIALLFIATVVAQSPDTGRTTRIALLFAGGVAAGLGKNEWTFSLAAALVFTAIAHPLIRHAVFRNSELETAGPANQATAVVIAVALGLICGNLASYLADQTNYVGGWRLLGGMIFRASILSGDTSRWWVQFRQEVPYIVFHFVVAAASVVLLIRYWRIYSVTLLLAFAFANALFFSYVISSWAPLPRYFAPSYIGLGATFLIILLGMPPTPRSWIVTATMIVVALQSAYYQKTHRYWQIGRGNTAIAAWITKHETAADRCVLVVDYSFVLDRPSVDFVHEPFGLDVVNSYLAKIGRAACPP